MWPSALSVSGKPNDNRKTTAKHAAPIVVGFSKPVGQSDMRDICGGNAANVDGPFGFARISSPPFRLSRPANWRALEVRMFKCDECRNVSEPGQTSRALVSRKRQRSYELLDKEGRRVRVVSGWEIVRERRLCAQCYEKAMKIDEYRDETSEAGQIKAR
jgi:hypothetical protein